MRATWLPLLAIALIAALPRGGWSQARPPERALPLPLPPPPTPAPPPAQAAFQPAPFGRPVAGGAAAPIAARAAAASAAPAGRWVAIYAAVAPASAHGVSPVVGDRMMAHVRAETLCRAQPGGDTCRQLLELREGCGVLVQAVRDHRPLRFGTPPPDALARLPTALSLAVQGPDLVTAEREAMARCQERERGLSCRVVASACTASR
jgi:hypothetical protein